MRQILAGHVRAAALITTILAPAGAQAQAPTPPAQIGAIQLPTVVVTAQKEPADAQALPVSVTAVPRDTLVNGGATVLRDAAIYAPNTYFSDFSARKLSNQRFRGIGSSPSNPAVTTYLDGVPQLNANTSSVELLDVEQVEFVRGPQSALFGRNTLGGLINVISARPSITDWTGAITVPVSNLDGREIRGSFSGPLVAGRAGISGSLSYGRRDGYTRNDLTGNDLDSRSAVTGKAQLLWTPSAIWETRVIVTGERARDGDYALSDLGGLRANPFHTSRDFEGHTDRDLFGTTVLTRREGARVNLTTTTGILRWKTVDATDLDYSPLPLLRRDNAEDSVQLTQEVRLASAPDVPLDLGGVPLKWQTGVFAFTQTYEQDAVNTLAPFLLSPFVPFAVEQHSPEAALDDLGVGFYGQVTATLGDRLDLTAGGRFDHEHKEATIRTFFEPALGPPGLVEEEEDFSNVSPQVAAAFRLDGDRLLYAQVARGFKAGGFNAASPAGSEAYGEEHSWNVEGGLKTAWANGRVVANAAVFRIDWEELQLNLPDPAVPAQFYIANVAGAVSTGVEVEINARAVEGVEVFGAVGVTRARFEDGSLSSGIDVSDNLIPNTPEYTATLGAQVSRPFRGDGAIYARGEVVRYGSFQYDDLNTAAQEAYSLTNLRAGVRGSRVFAEAWIRNAFDTHYVPVALPFDRALAPSGFIGEMGAPRTFGVSTGVTF